MLTLSCALVGEKGNFFAIDVNASESVDHLKDAIKRKDEKTTTCEARELELVLAKKGEAWLPDNDQAALDLEEGKVHQDIQALIDGEKMKATWTIGDVLTAKSMVERRKAPKSKQIHVLVVVPKQVDREQWDEERARKKARSLTVIEDGRMNSIGVDLDIDMWQIGGIALNIHHVEPDFPAWLYVRKETQDITTTIRKRISVLCWWEHLGRAY